jgi:RNA polymerase sigma factor (TIGR02999 family)
MATSTHEVTQLLVAWGQGDQGALDKLLPLVYDELHRMAQRYMRRQNPDHTLQTTALINEAYLKLVGQPEQQWQNRAHFFGVAAQAMRHILVDYARARGSAKREGERQAVSFDETAVASLERAAEIVALDEELQSLAIFDRRKSQVVELRFFGGLSVEEVAEVLQVSPKTVKRDWQVARMWLLRELAKQ